MSRIAVCDRWLVCVAAVFSITQGARAQAVLARHPATVVARDSGAVMQKLAAGVYVILHEDAVHSFPEDVTDWPHGNTGVVAGRDGILVIDSDFFPSRAAADIALIRQVTDKPVKYLVNTHWHGDHTHGNAVYRDSFPQISIVGATPNAQYIGVNQLRYPLSTLAASSALRTQLQREEAMLAANADTTGREFSSAEHALLAKVVGEHRTQLREFALVRGAPPTRLFDRALTLDLGGRRVELVNRGHANSPADVTIYVPDAQVLFTGDIVVWPVPYTIDCYPSHWVPVLRSIEETPIRSLVPGHGPVFHDHQYVTQLRTLFETAVLRTDTLARQGKTRAQIAAALDLQQFHPLFVKPGDRNAEAYWHQMIEVLLPERVYQCVVGSRC